MESTVGLFNIALARLGGEQLPRNISSLENNTIGALCENLFPHILDHSLQVHCWSFALRRVLLALLPQDSQHQLYNLKYALPSDCVKPVRLAGYEGINRSPVYIVMGGALLCNEENAELEYVSRVKDPKQWPPALADALAWRLAAELATAQNNNAGKMQFCLENYRLALNDAIVKDLQEQNMLQPESVWQASRHGKVYTSSSGRF